MDVVEKKQILELKIRERGSMLVAFSGGGGQYFSCSPGKRDSGR